MSFTANTYCRGANGFRPPEGGFFLWLPVPEQMGDGEAAALKLWVETGVRVLPGAYLSREVGGQNPGARYVRVALVAPIDEMQRGLTRLRDCLYGRGERSWHPIRHGSAIRFWTGTCRRPWNAAGES